MPRKGRQYGEKTKKKQSVAGQETVRRVKTLPTEPAPRRKSPGSSHIQLVGGKQKPRGFKEAASLAEMQGVGIPEVTCCRLEAGGGSPTDAVDSQNATPLRGYKNGGRTMTDRRDELARRKRKRRKRRCICTLLVIALLALSGLTIGTYLAVRQTQADDEGSSESPGDGDGSGDGSGEPASGIDEALERSPGPRRPPPSPPG